MGFYRILSDLCYSGNVDNQLVWRREVCAERDVLLTRCATKDNRSFCKHGKSCTIAMITLGMSHFLVLTTGNNNPHRVQSESSEDWLDLPLEVRPVLETLFKSDNVDCAFGRRRASSFQTASRVRHFEFIFKSASWIPETRAVNGKRYTSMLGMNTYVQSVYNRYE